MIPRQRPTSGFLLLCLVICLGQPALWAREDGSLVTVESHLAADQPERALELLESTLRKGKPCARSLLLRSTARIMIGQTDAGEADLRRALKLDPSLKQGWINLAALEIASERYGAAQEAFDRAKELPPKDPGDHLNLGAVAVLRGQMEAAKRQFGLFLSQRNDGESYYLVAANYALAGREAEAVAHLSQAFGKDERLRLRARADNKFVLLSSTAYRNLLETDRYTPPEGAYRRSAAFRIPYDRQDGKLLRAVLDSLVSLQEPYDPRIEATASWAIIWGEMRIKITNQANGTGVIFLSAPAERFDADTWSRRTQNLLRTIHTQVGQLGKLERLRPPD